MLHSRLQDMLDEMLSDPDELFIASKSRRSALISLRDGTTFFIEGDFSGTQEECEAEARRILSDTQRNSRRVRS
jgi:hypothetical protein